MESDALSAMQVILDGIIKPELQPFYEQFVSAYKAGWRDALNWTDNKSIATHDYNPTT